MKRMSTYLLVMFMVMFWIFRVVVALTASVGRDMGFPVANLQTEIILLFVDVVLIVLVIKRKLLGGIVFLVINLAYFGPELITSIGVINSGEAVLTTYSALFESFIAIILSAAILFEMIFERSKMGAPKDKKTDWFYKNSQYDRELDERADKNNYRTL